jgi:excisionase family DNA binding protein
VTTNTKQVISRLLPARAAALETGIPYTTLRDLVFRGEMPVVRIGRAWYYDRRDLDRFIDASKSQETV